MSIVGALTGCLPTPHFSSHTLLYRYNYIYKLQIQIQIQLNIQIQKHMVIHYTIQIQIVEANWDDLQSD